MALIKCNTYNETLKTKHFRFIDYCIILLHRTAIKKKKEKKKNDRIFYWKIPISAIEIICKGAILNVYRKNMKACARVHLR